MSKQKFNVKVGGSKVVGKKDDDKKTDSKKKVAKKTGTNNEKGKDNVS